MKSIITEIIIQIKTTIKAKDNLRFLRQYIPANIITIINNMILIISVIPI